MKPTKKELEEDYINMTNQFCCKKYDISQRTLLKWIDKMEIRRKGSPGRENLVEINMNRYWNIDTKWYKPIAYNEESGLYLMGDKWIRINGLKSRKRL